MNYQTKDAIKRLSPAIKDLHKDLTGKNPLSVKELQAKYKSSETAIKNVLEHCGYDAEKVLQTWRAKRGLKLNRPVKNKWTGSDSDERRFGRPNILLRSVWV